MSAAPERAAARRRWGEAGLLALGLFLGYLLFPAPGDPWWDAWMTATVLASWSEVGAAEILYFAHPLIIPLTKVVAVVGCIADPLLAAAVRESLFAALAAGLLYLLAHALLARRGRALVVALAYALPFEHWRAATTGEEKASLVFFALLVLVCFFQLRGWVEVPPLGRLSRRALALALGPLLALAFAVHLQNGLLFPVVLLVTVARPAFWRRWRPELSELLTALVPGTLLALGFYGATAALAHGVRGPGEFLAWLLQYHQTEHFTSQAHTLLDQLLVYASTVKEYLLPWARWGEPRLEVLVLAAGLVAACVLAWRARPGLAATCLLLLLVSGVNLFRYVPVADNWDGIFYLPVLIVALGTLRGPRRWPVALWGLAVVGLLAVDVAYFVTFDVGARPVAADDLGPTDADVSWLARRHRRLRPLCQLAIAADRRIPRDAVVLTGGRHLVNALRVCAGRRAHRAGHLRGAEPDPGRPEAPLESLSRFFYVPRASAAEVRASGRPVVFLTQRGPPGVRMRRLLGERWSAIDLGFRAARLFVLLPESGASPSPVSHPDGVE